MGLWPELIYSILAGLWKYDFNLTLLLANDSWEFKINSDVFSSTTVFLKHYKQFASIWESCDSALAATNIVADTNVQLFIVVIFLTQ